MSYPAGVVVRSASQCLNVGADLRRRLEQVRRGSSWTRRASPAESYPSTSPNERKVPEMATTFTSTRYVFTIPEELATSVFELASARTAAADSPGSITVDSEIASAFEAYVGGSNKGEQKALAARGVEVG